MKNNNKELSIQVNLNGLSFCIRNNSTDSIEYIKYYKFSKRNTPHETLPELKAYLSSEPIFSQDFNSVIILHQNELATIVPSKLYDENNNADYLKFNSKILKSDYIAHDDLDLNDTKIVYVPYVNINNFIFDTFGQFTYKHTLTVFVETVLKNTKKITRPIVYINVNKDSFELLVIENGKLILSNIHEYYTKEDFIYYILFSFEQLNLNPEETKIVLSGFITDTDDNFNLLFKYVRHIEFNKVLAQASSSKSSLPNTHEFFLILNSF